VIAVQNFDTAEIHTFPLGQFELCQQLGGHSIGRASYEPGWKWSQHVGPAVGTNLCQASHVGVVLAGQAAVRMADGHEVVLRVGDVFVISGRHDSWVVGDEPYVSIHLDNADAYAVPDPAGRVIARRS
jgi:hypothetical protein